MTDELRIKGNYGSLEVLHCLRQAKEASIVTTLLFFEVDFDEQLVQAMEGLFFETTTIASSSSSTQGEEEKACQWERVHFKRCTGTVRAAIHSLSKSNVSDFHFSDHDGNNNPITTSCRSSFEQQQCEVFSNSNLTKITFSNIVLSKQDGVLLATALKDNHTLRSFGLTGSHHGMMDRQGIEALANGLKSNQNLQSTQFSRCRLMDGEMTLLLTALKHNRSLRSLALDGNFCRSQALSALCTLLEDRTELAELDLSDQHNDVQSMDLSHLMRTIRRHAGLKVLTMKDCNLPDQDLQIVIDTLCINRSLECIDLRYNDFSPLGLKYILAPKFHQMKALKRVMLRQGRGILHEDVRDAMVQGMKENWNIEFLDLFDWEKSMEYYMDLNRAKRLLLRDLSFDSALWPLVLERAYNRIDDVYRNEKQLSTRQQSHCLTRKANACFYFLRNGPMLLNK